MEDVLPVPDAPLTSSCVPLSISFVMIGFPVSKSFTMLESYRYSLFFLKSYTCFNLNLLIFSCISFCDINGFSCFNMIYTRKIIDNPNNICASSIIIPRVRAGFVFILKTFTTITFHKAVYAGCKTVTMALDIAIYSIAILRL